MEQKNIEKIEKLYDLIYYKNEKLKERYEAIKESLLTPDMKKLMLVLNDHYKNKIKFDNCEVSLQFIDKDVFHNNVFVLKYFNPREKRLIPWDLPDRGNWSDQMICTLEQRIKESKDIDQRLTFIENHMEEFVRKISEYYKEFTEKESDKLDELLAEMDYETKPTKHLKVTVEWI